MPQRTPGPDCPLPRGGANLAARTCGYFSPRRLGATVLDWADLRLPTVLTCRHLSVAAVGEGCLAGRCTHPELRDRDEHHPRL